jgi:carbamate kinase
MGDISVVAMGGNSLIDPALAPTVENQFAITAGAVVPIAELVAQGERLILTHGNGPQVGFMQLRVEMARGVLHEVPLDSLVADSQGGIGYMIQMTLRGELERRGVAAEVATLLTEVEVDPHDQAFEEPTKPIGKFYGLAESQELTAKYGWQMVEDSHRGYRRVVPSPSPVRIVELVTIRRLTDAGVIVIACGGGGIPVMRREDGRTRGIECVIDKDRASAVLAVELGAKRLIITTGVDAVCADFMTPQQRTLRETTVSEIRELGAQGQFPPGSMRPKMDAALYFLNRGGEEVFVCRPEALAEALAGRAGTRITAD